MQLQIELWDIWYANFKYEESDEFKDRPVLVIGIDSNGELIVSAMITGTEERSMWGEYDISRWQSAGLSKPSTVRFSRTLTLRETDFRRKVGHLHPEDITRAYRYIV